MWTDFGIISAPEKVGCIFDSEIDIHGTPEFPSMLQRIPYIPLPNRKVSVEWRHHFYW